MRPFLFDMETSDPDDYLTLILLLGHPEVDLRAVSITPGTREQVSLVRQLLSHFNRQDLRIGARDIDYKKNCVSRWHYDAFQFLHPKDEGTAEVGWELLDELFVTGTTLVCGAALSNVGEMLRRGRDIPRGRLFVQGGFAGEGVIPRETQLEKFKGRISCPSFNLDGDKESARLIISRAKSFEDLRFISKNVCHGILFDQQMSEECERLINEIKSNHNHFTSWELIQQGMGYYLKKKPHGKAFHDPFAACCAIDPSIATWERVILSREKDGWTSLKSPESDVRIVVDYDREAFLRTMTGCPQVNETRGHPCP